MKVMQFSYLLRNVHWVKTSKKDHLFMLGLFCSETQYIVLYVMTWHSNSAKNKTKLYSLLDCQLWKQNTSLKTFRAISEPFVLSSSLYLVILISDSKNKYFLCTVRPWVRTWVLFWVDDGFWPGCCTSTSAKELKKAAFMQLSYVTFQHLVEHDVASCSAYQD